MKVRAAISTLTAGGCRRRWTSVLVGVVVSAALLVSVVSLALAASGFPDVPANHPYYAAINNLASRGIIGGYENGNFGPDNSVMRQQFAKMIVLAGGYSVSESDVCPFADVANSGPASLYPDNYVAVCAANGITNGTTATTFNPYGNITRLQVISMVVRAADDLHPGLLSTPPSTWTGTPGWGSDPTHGANARRAEYNQLLTGLNLSLLSPSGNMSRGEVAQVLYNLLNKLTPPTTTTSSSTTTTLVTTTTTSSSTTTTSTTSTTVAYEKLGGNLTSAPTAASWATSRLDVFARGSNGALMHIGYNGFWLPWEDLGGELAANSSPAAVSWGAHPIDVFIRGTDDALWHRSYSTGAWSIYESLGGVLTSSPAVASQASGLLDVFVRGSNGALWQKSYDGVWSGWTSLGGTMKSGSDPAAVSWEAGRLDVFVRGTDDALWHRSWDGAWSSWESLGGVLTSSPAVASWMVGRLDVFARGAGNTLWHKYYHDGAWSAWQDMGGGAVASAPAAVSWGLNRIDLFVRGTDNALWHRWGNGSTWTP